VDLAGTHRGSHAVRSDKSQHGGRLPWESCISFAGGRQSGTAVEPMKVGGRSSAARSVENWIMFQRFRKLIFLGAIGSSVAVPYLAATGKGLDSVRQFFAGSGRPAAPAINLDNPAASLSDLDGLDPLVQSLIHGTSNQVREIAPPHELTNVFRFDITIDWILQQWPSVSMVSSDLELQGYRVPLVTGINEDDVAGSLTYYFGTDRKLKKITFDGVTGNADRLIREVAGPNGMTRAVSEDPALFLFQRSSFGKSQSELRIRPAEMLSQTNAHRRFQVSMTLVPQAGGWF